MVETLFGHKVKLIYWAVELSNRLYHVRKQLLIGIDDDYDDDCDGDDYDDDYGDDHDGSDDDIFILVWLVKMIKY